MAEATFAKTYLTTLDSRPRKISADHVEDARRFPGRPPYILPRMPKPMSKPSTASKPLPGQEPSTNVTLRSMRNPPLEIRLTSQPLTTSLLDIKTAVSARARVPVEKLKILHNKRPVQDSKILREVLDDDGTAVRDVEFAIMVIGGAAAVLPESTDGAGEDEKNAAATGAGAGAGAVAGEAELETDAFWNDLNGFLLQRLKDEAAAAELARLFKSSWLSSKAGP